jgi:hypothetical protein
MAIQLASSEEGKRFPRSYFFQGNSSWKSDQGEKRVKKIQQRRT